MSNTKPLSYTDQLINYLETKMKEKVFNNAKNHILAFKEIKAEEYKEKKEAMKAKENVIYFGKYSKGEGKTYEEVAKWDTPYLNWCLKQSFLDSLTKTKIKNAIASVE